MLFRRLIPFVMFYALFFAVCPSMDAEGSLARNFSNPPDSARPWVFWHWMGGYISREGITADLEAMRRVGIHGALVVNICDGHAAQGRRVPLETTRFPPAGSFTFTTWKAPKPAATLQSSGLLGPVTLRPAARLLISTEKNSHS